MARFGMTAVALAISAGQLLAAQPEMVNGIVALVNDKVITRREVEVAVAGDRELLTRQYGRNLAVLVQKEKELRRDQLELLVENQLILRAVETEGLKIPEAIIEEHIKDTIRRRYRDRLTLMKTLPARGITYESYRRQIRDEFIIRIMTMRNVSSTIVISPYKIETYYSEHADEFKVGDQVKLRVIKLNYKPDRSPGATHELAEKLLAELSAGASFKELALKWSDGSQKAEGGEWPWYEPSQLNPTLASAVQKLEPGQRSGVIEFSDSCYLLLLEEKRAARTKPLAEVRDDIEKTLQLQEEQRLRKQWINRLKAKSFVQYIPLN
jgi:peptidyl-prolyl cis-trans isomerase SurA